MEVYEWWKNSSEDILLCPDKLKLIRVIVKQECQIREISGFPKLQQAQVNKLVALMELKFLLEQKQ